MNTSKLTPFLALIICLSLALAIRLPHLTAFITADEARSWFGRSLIFTDALYQGNWANTAPNSEISYLENISLSPAPGVTTMWLGAIGIVLHYLYTNSPLPLDQHLRHLPFDPLDPAMLFWLRFPGVVISVVATGLVFWWSRPVLGLLGATLAALFFALDPFHVALSRVLGHDALVATFMGLALLASLNALTLSQQRYHLASAFFTALAVLSKYPALSLAAFIIINLTLIRLGQLRHPKRSGLRQLGRELTLWLITFSFSVLLLWPALWQHPLAIPLEILQDAARAAGNPHQKGSFFLGQPVPDPGASFYLIVFLFRTTPLGLLGFMVALGVIGYYVYRHQGAKLLPYAYILIFIIFYTLLVSYGGKKQDRYLLPIFPAVAFIAASGYTYIIRQWRLLNPFMMVSLITILQLSFILPTHPYYFSYYNPLFGGAPQAARLMQVGWGEGLNEAAFFLNQRPHIQTQAAVSWYSTTFEPYFAGKTIYKIDEAKISRDPKPGLAANYVILYINQLQRQLPSTGALAYFQQTPPLHVVQLNGLDYAYIYPAPAVSQLISQTSRLVGQAELLGFDWLNLSQQPLAANSVPTLRLYWEWQGKAEADPINLSLVDSNGYTIGWAHLISSTETTVIKQDGAIITSDYAMPISPGTLPGQYALKAWIDRPATQERVGEFPLESFVTLNPPMTPTQLSDFELTHSTPITWPAMTLLGYNLDATPWPVTESRTLEIVGTRSALPVTLTNITVELIPQFTWPDTPTVPLISPTLTYPPHLWQPNDIYRTWWPLTLPAYLPPGSYDLALKLNQYSQPIGTIEVLGRARLFTPPPLAHPLSAPLGDAIKLLGYTLTPTDTTFDLTLVWQALATPPQDYTVFVQLVNSSHQVVAQQDRPPQAGQAPTHTWAKGEIITDSYNLPYPATAPQDYHILIGLYDPNTGQRLPTGSPDNAIAIPFLK